MNFETPTNTVECPERQDVVDRAILELSASLKALGINEWQLPQITIKFIDSKSRPDLGSVVLGNVDVHGGNVEIIYDQRFASPESEASLLEELRQAGTEYPGMVRTLKHELAHIAMWSVTGLPRQNATRLLDEGWADLAAHGKQEGQAEDAKALMKQGLSEEPEIFTRCLDFSKPVTYEENLNSAEYVTGEALLLWIQERFGKEKMIELLQKSPSPQARFEDNDMHTVTEADRMEEGKRFEAALLTVTGFQNPDEVKSEFLNWVNH